MCKAVSLLVSKSGKIYWKTGIDSHDDLLKEFKDSELQDAREPPHNTFARVEISPKNNDYLNPNKSNWELKLDENIKPEWWDLFIIQGEAKLWSCWAKWKKEVYSQINLKEAKNPIHPFKIKAPQKITKKHITLLQKWASVWDSVGASVRASVRASVWDSVGASVRASVRDSVRDSVGDSVRASVGDSVGASVRASVRDSVGDSVWDSVGDSVRDSVWDSVRAYNGSLFPKIKKWKYCEKIKEKGYPFKSAVKLWKMGLVPSYDGKVWRLHGSKNGDGKISILWSGKIK